MIGTDVAGSPKFETEGLTYDQAAQEIAAQGINSVVLKDAELKIMPAGTTLGQVHDEIIKMVASLKKYNVKAFVWQRQWLQRSGSLNTGAEDYASEMKMIIDKAKAAGVDDNIKGLAIIENNLENTSQVLSQALSIVNKINTKTNGWLKTKIFLFPGAGMGSYFKGINTAAGNATFFNNMDSQVGQFSFIYKHMLSQDISVCSLGSLNAEWSINVGNNSTLTKSQQLDYINSNLGLNNLSTFLSSNVVQYPNLCNVTFWGDSGDGLIKMSAVNVQAVNEALVQSRGWKGYFYDMVYAKNTATGNELNKFILTVNNGAVSKNQTSNAVNTMTVWDEWNRWQWANPGY